MSVFDPVKAMTARSKCLAAGGLVLALVLLTGLPRTPDEAVDWVAVRSQKLEHEIGLVGKIEPLETVIVSAPFEGVVSANDLSPGMPVEKGQALLALDTALLEIKVRDALASKLKAQQVVETYRTWATGQEAMQARQMLRLAELSMQTLDLELSQVEALYQKGIVARNELDALKQQRQLQSLELASTRAQLKYVLASGKREARTIAEMEYQNASIVHQQLSALLEHKTLAAPFSGVVLSMGGPQPAGGEVSALHKGVLVAKGQQLMKLADMGGLKVVAQVSEADVNTFSLKQKVALSAGGFSGLQLSGQVSAISQIATPDESVESAATFPITITVNAPENGDFKNVRLGMSVHMTIVTYRNENSFIIPHAAVEQAGDAMFVEHRENLGAPVVRREVTIGQSTAQGVEVFGLNSGFVSVRSL
ncbi:efflux RND transporter periplasmic adaptor subunit [Pseudomonas sp. DSV-1]|uniref:efflux RND transporter periplasmic adaptor subunit n=1 Tax=Pseudomonas sp. DSV-1 TaxID=3112250 RepID=UPI002DBB1143|nr:HlyD family efflux transporter periplasmic adaptor subunit [Pseudomonas sp. DSV-1]MEC4238027.1 HlyD family efflux transporter periplasmic adaptor subunit [Pseudomonas sp. DSV-1]